MLGASPGNFGGNRAVATVRSILGNIGVDVFDDQGRLKDAELHGALEATVHLFARFMR